MFIDERITKDLAKYLLEVSIRNYGLCASLVDEGELTSEEILEKLVLGKRKKPIEPKPISEEEIEKQYLENKQDLQERLLETKQEYQKEKELLRKVCILLDQPYHSFLFTDMLTKVKQKLQLQLEILLNNKETLQRRINTSFEEYKQQELDSYTRKLQRYEAEIQEYENSLDAKQPLQEEYKALIKEVTESLSSVEI